MSPILDSYEQILTAFHLTVDEEGLISQRLPTGTTVPLKVSNRRLVMPTKAWQRKGYGEDYLPFHPGCEVMSREGTSEVIQMLQRQTKAVVSHMVVLMAKGLLDVAVDKDTHKDLPLECTDFLKKLANADDTTKALFEKLLAAAVKKNRLLTVYLKNGGKYDGKKVNRSCIIRFPILEDLQADTKDNLVLGVTVPKKQRPTLVALFKLVVPFGDNAEEYSFGTTGRVAPYLVSLLTSYHKIATVLNQLVNTYAQKLHIPVKPIELYDLKIIDVITKNYGDIPPYSGNEGQTAEQPEEASETVTLAKKAAAKVNAPKETVAQVSRNTPVATETQVTTGKGAASMADFMNAMNPQQNQFNLHQAPQQMNTGFTPVQFAQPAANGFNPQGFNTNPVSPYAPVMLQAPAWATGGVPQNTAPANPFMAATMTGTVGSGSTGLI